jgi:hypothetical protein
MAAVGEDQHYTGMVGLQKVKQWLDLTTRVDSVVTAQDRPWDELLKFEWPHAKTAQSKPFSFDLAGKFRGDDIENQSFLAEVKAYKRQSDLAMHYTDFLAKCYIAMSIFPARCDNFLWISYSPFEATVWDKHSSYDKVYRSVLSNRERALGKTAEAEAKPLIDARLVNDVASRVWLITLSVRQEKLVLQHRHWAEVVTKIKEESLASP